MSNVVAFPSRQRTSVNMDVPKGLPQPIQDLIYIFYDWGQQNGIDTDTQDFKYDAATVVAVAQSILQRKN